MARFTPKLTFAVAGGKPNFKISGADWRRIQTAYGHQLSKVVRRKIRDATGEFLNWAVFELTAPTISETTKRIQTIKKAAREFREKILRCPPTVGRDADFYARYLIRKHLGLSRDEGRDGLQNLALQVERAISKGCDLALVDLLPETKSGFRKGDMWDLWVRKLTAILKECQLPTAVRKDTDKVKAAEPSAFVAFIREATSVHSDGL